VEERRDSFRRHARALIAAAALAAGLGGALAGVARACELPPGTRVESQRVALSYRTIPPKIAVGEHFALELAACPKQGAVLSDRVKLDAQMPEHKHGMNYRPSVKLLGPGRYRSEGWLFHMPGRWEFVFELGGERLTHSVRIE
jgi:hypothetical protein